ncbi:hypothetical protein PGB90_000525 [Kerria lacca]
MSDKCTILEDLCTPLQTVKTHLNNIQHNKILRSKISSFCKVEKCIVGIDEAGRGPVLGPMVYGICFCLKKEESILKKLGCADSKSLTEDKREDIFKKICFQNDFLGWAVDVISPNQISNCMLRRQVYYIYSAIGLIQLLQKNEVNVSEVYIDTVGPPEKYEEKLSKIFPDIIIKVSKKADSLFPVVSAASICAKVIRDLALKNWNFLESIKINEENGWGSGYPNDPQTKTFLKENIDPIFGFPQIVRFSWSTAQNILKDNAVPVYWSDDDNEDSDDTNTSITSFFKQSDVLSKHPFFIERNLTPAQFL